MTSTDRYGRRDLAPLSEQAAQWWVVLNEESCSAADRHEFAQWVRRSPERVEAFLRVCMLNNALHSDQVRWPDTPAEELIRQAQAAPAQVISLSRLRRDDAAVAVASGERSSWTNARVLLVASVAALFTAAAVFWIRQSPDHYRTDLGEQRSVLLSDGSVITLNTSSDIEVNYGKQRRLIRLVSGEALFNVKHDAARPFDVAAGHAVVRAVGTRFNVDRRADHTTVTVVEGKVRVGRNVDDPREADGSSAPPPESFDELVLAAQRVVVTQAGMSAPEPIRNVVPVTAWTQRQLVFESRPLSEVAAEFNRYNRHQIVIESAQLQRQEVTGVFQANDSAAFLAFIAGIPGVSIQTNDAGHHAVSLMNQTEAGPPNGGRNRTEEIVPGGGPN